MWLCLERLDLLLLRRVGRATTQVGIMISRTRVSKKQSNPNNSLTGSCNCTWPPTQTKSLQFSVKFTSYHGVMVLKAINQWTFKHVPLQMLQVRMRFLVSHSATAVARHGLPTWSCGLSSTRGACVQEEGNHGIHSFLRENPTTMRRLSKKGVWEKGNQSDPLALAFIFYP